MKLLLSLLPFLLLGDLPADEPVTYRLKIEATVTIERVTEPIPDPDPTPDPVPDPTPLPASITVGPGKQFESLEQIDPTAIPANAQIQLFYRPAPYRAKFAIVKPGVLLKGIPGPNGERPTISGENAKTHQKFPVGVGFQTVLLVYVGADNATISGINFRDLWEDDPYVNSAGESKLGYGGGASCLHIRDARGVTIQDCDFTEAIHSVFSRGVTKGNTLTIKNCVVANCGNKTAVSDEAMYLEDDTSVLENVTIRDCRNTGTTCLHCRSRQATLKDCQFSGGGLLVYTDSISEKDSPCLVDGKLPDAKASVTGGKYVSRSQSPFFALRSDVGSDIAIRELTVDGATLVGISDQRTRFRRTIGTPGFEGNSITYQNCTVGLLPATDGQPATQLEWLDSFSKGTVIIGNGIKEYVYEKNAVIPGSANVKPDNWQSLITVEKQTFSKLQERFLK